MRDKSFTASWIEIDIASPGYLLYVTDEAERLVETTDLVLPLGFHSEQELACGFQVDHAALGVLGNDMDVLE